MDLAAPLPLNEDVLHLILQQLRYDSPQSLYAMCLVSRRFHTLSTPYLYRTVLVGDGKTGVRLNATGELCIVVENEDTLKKASQNKVSLEMKPSDALYSSTPGRLEIIKKYTREVVVKGHVSGLQVVELLMSMQQLEHLKWAWWAEPLPAVVISRFSQRWPNAQLSAVDFRVNNITPRPALLDPNPSSSLPATRYNFQPEVPRAVSSYDVLMHCANLRSLKATINDGLGTGLAYLGAVIASCPNLKEVRLAQCKVGTNVISQSASYSFCFSGNEKLPLLEKLMLETCFFPSLEIKLCDSSQLRHLELRNTQMKFFLRTLHGRDLPRLKVFRIEERCIWNPEGLQENLAVFLLDLPSLDVLSLSGVVGRIPMSVITTHGQTLHSLQLQETQHWMQTRNTSSALGTKPSCPMLTSEEINLLSTECPHLERLTLDICRGGDWPWQHLNALVQHKSLRFLTLYTSINTISSEEAIGSQILKVNEASAKNLFLQLRAMKQGKPLEELHINLGEWNRIRYRYEQEHMHPLDVRCGNLLTCSMNYQSGEVIVTDAWAELRRSFTRSDLWRFDRFIEPLDARFIPDFPLRG